VFLVGAVVGASVLAGAFAGKRHSAVKRWVGLIVPTLAVLVSCASQGAGEPTSVDRSGFREDDGVPETDGRWRPVVDGQEARYRWQIQRSGATHGGMCLGVATADVGAAVAAHPGVYGCSPEPGMGVLDSAIYNYGSGDAAGEEFLYGVTAPEVSGVRVTYRGGRTTMVRPFPSGAFFIADRAAAVERLTAFVGDRPVESTD
jgi:hypothetical protein